MTSGKIYAGLYSVHYFLAYDYGTPCLATIIKWRRMVSKLPSVEKHCLQKTAKAKRMHPKSIHCIVLWNSFYNKYIFEPYIFGHMLGLTQSANSNSLQT